MPIIIDDTNDFSLLTTSGQIRYQFSLSGTYSFYFTFGCCQVFVYKNRKKYDVYSRFWIPDDMKPLKISRELGFKIFSSDSLPDSAIVWLHVVHTFVLKLFSLGFDFSSLAHKDINNLFRNQIELNLKE